MYLEVNYVFRGFCGFILDFLLFLIDVATYKKTREDRSSRVVSVLFALRITVKK